MEASGRCGRRGKFGTLPGVVGAVPLEGVGDRKEILAAAAGLLLAAVLVFSTRGEEGNFHVRLMQGPRAVWLPYMVRYFHVDTYWGQGATGRQDMDGYKTSWDPAAATATATATAVRDTHAHTRGQPTRDDGRRDTLVQPAP